MSDETKLLGKPLHSFSPKKAEVVAGYLLAVGFGLGGIAVACHMALREDSKPLGVIDFCSKYLLILIFAVGGPLVGSLFYLIMKNHDQIQLTICENGFVFEQNGTCERVLWSELASIAEVVSEGGAFRSIMFRRRSGTGLGMQSNWVDDYKKLREIANGISLRHSIPWEEI